MGAISKSVCALFLIISVFLLTNAKKYHVPLLIWGQNYELLKEEGFPVLKRVSSDEFANHFLKNVNKEKSEKPVVLVFAEETFSTEDFGFQVTKYVKPFPSLEKIADTNVFEYLLSVEDPLAALASSDVKSYGFSLSEVAVNDLKDENFKRGVVYLINLEDADSKEDRPDMLQRHDAKIAEIYKRALKNNKNVIAVLTGRYSSWTEPEEVIRVRRQANETGRNDSKLPEPAEAKSGVVLETNTALIYTKSPPVLKIDDKEVTLQSATGVSDDREKLQRAIFSFATDLGRLKLRFRFENSSNLYWNLSQVELELPSGLVLLTTKREITAPYEHSFHTTTPVVFVNGSMSLTFSDIQVQPWKLPGEQNRKFGVAENSDATFFTPPIWTGLIVTSIIGLILMWALSMITDIRTMDQFDDPKGKTITVNVTD